MKLKNRDLVELAILVLFIFLLVLLVVLFFYLKSEGGMCLTNPLQYIANKTGDNCYCIRIPKY